MSRFNGKSTKAAPAMKRAKTVTRNKTVNLAGGEAFALTKQFELVSVLLTSFCADQFYRSGNDTIDRVKQLVQEVDPLFAAKAAIYARDKFNMRSISHVVAAELAKHGAGIPNIRRFFNAVVVRPDDMAEIVSLAATRERKNGKYAIPKALKEGLKMAFGKFDGYQLAKYRMEGNEWSLVDLVNMVRPVPTDANAAALSALVRGELKSTDTWETKLTQAGQQADSEEEKEELKADAWRELLAEGKLGYMALLRNLRNIVQQAPDCIDMVCQQLVIPEKIKKSRVLPFRFWSAYRELKKVNGATKVLTALSKACDIALANVPVLKKTLVVLDCSASMTSPCGGKMATVNCNEAGAMLAACLVKASAADMMVFSDNAKYKTVDANLPVLALAEQIAKGNASGGTNFHAIFKTIRGKYDRIVVLSDMQGWVGYTSPEADFQAYKRANGVDPYIYSIDLAGYGSAQFCNDRVLALAGFSEKLFDVMKLAEQDRNAIIEEINKIQF